VILNNTYSVGTACATTVQNVKEIIYLHYSGVNIYKLNTEKSTTLKDGHLLATGDRRAYQQTLFQTTHHCRQTSSRLVAFDQLEVSQI
jgi:hypothetical protein